MKKGWFLLILSAFCLMQANAQTVEDVEKLGLTRAQMAAALEKKQIILTSHSGRKKKKIKEGAFASIRLKGDTAKINLILSEFLSDTIIVSTVSPKVVNEEITMGFNEFKLLRIQDIEMIEYSVRNINGTYWTSFIMTITGLTCAVVPVVTPLIIGNTEEVYSQPQFPFIVGGGVVLFVWGWKLTKSLIPKEYKIGTDWNYKVVTK